MLNTHHILHICPLQGQVPIPTGLSSMLVGPDSAVSAIFWCWKLCAIHGFESASAHSQHLQANCIHLSHAASAAMNAVEHGIPLLYRGCSNIKGKGEMHTFWIFGYHPEARTDSSSPMVRRKSEGFKAGEGSGKPRARKSSATSRMQSRSLRVPYTP